MNRCRCPTDLTPTTAIYTCYMRPRLNNLNLHLVCQKFHHELSSLSQDFSKTTFVFCSYDAVRAFFAFVAAEERSTIRYVDIRHFSAKGDTFITHSRGFRDLFEPVILPEMWSRFEDIQDLLQRYNIELIAVGVRVDIGERYPNIRVWSRIEIGPRTWRGGRRLISRNRRTAVLRRFKSKRGGGRSERKLVVVSGLCW
jgi:hypothetical protein